MAKYFTQPGETVIGGLNNNNTPKHAKINTQSRLMAFMDCCTHQILESTHYFLYASTDLNTAGVKEYLITTPDSTTWAHMTIDMSGTAITQFDMFEGTGFAGTSDNVLTSFNNNRNSTSESVITVYADPTTDTDEGTLLKTYEGGSATQQSRSATGVETENMLILKQNSNYLLRFTSGSDNNLINLDLYWGELEHLT